MSNLHILNRITNTRRYSKIANIGSASLLLTSSVLSVLIAMTPAASADTLNYPWPTDTQAPCEYTNGGTDCHDPGNTSDQYNWYVDENGDGHFTGTYCGAPSGASGECYDGNGYQYRNCTSYTAWRLTQIGVSAGNTQNLGNGGQWYDKAPSAEQSLTPKAWDAAVVPGSVGHVAFIESVSSDGSQITVSEYNQGGNGFGGLRTGTPASLGFSKYVDFGIHPSTTPSLPTHKDLTWYDGNSLFGFAGTSYGTAATVTGYTTPYWAGNGQLSTASNEGVFWYLNNGTGGTTGTIYWIPGGNFASATAIRSGVGLPVWAGVGDFTGSGKRDSIAWYDGTNLYLFTGSGLTTVWYTSGYTTPAWAGVGRANGATKDELFWYLSSPGTIYTLQSTGSSFNGAVAARGPGIGAPTWAGVGDFDGDSYRNDLAWYSGGTLFTFEGSSLGTSGYVNGYSTPTWAGVGKWNGSSTKDQLFWYSSSSTTLYGIDNNGSQFTGAVTLRGPGIGAPVFADTGNFY